MNSCLPSSLLYPDRNQVLKNQFSDQKTIIIVHQAVGMTEPIETLDDLADSMRNWLIMAGLYLEKVIFQDPT